MKKFLSKITFIAAAVLSVAGFTSCNNNDDPHVPTQASVQEQTQVLSEARFLARIPEVAFKYADFTLTLEYNGGEKKTYNVSEYSKHDNYYVKLLEDEGREPNLAVRVIDIPFQYNAKRIVKATLSSELTEAGKQLIANAAEGEEFDFALSVMFGKCDKTGKFDTNNTKEVVRVFKGVYVKEFEAFLAVLHNYDSTVYKIID